MNLSFFIAKRLAFNKKQSFSGFIIRLSITATALGVAAMIITSAFVNGFQETIAQKVFSFWGHIRVQYYETGKSFISEETPIHKSSEVEKIIQANPKVLRVQSFATKSAVIEKNKNIEGILFKGVDEGYDSTTLQSFIQQGSWLSFNDSLYNREIIISSLMANELKLKLNDTIHIFFISPEEGTSVYRPVRVKGIYKTGIEEYDKLFAIGDIRLIRRLSNWQNDEIGGYEVILKDYKDMNEVNEQLNLPVIWNSKTIKEIYPNIFEWLNIQDLNKMVLFIIMTVVAVINLITCLLILVLERIRMIGVLKAIGTNNATIRKIFLYHATIIALIGISIGCIVGIGLSLLQQYTGFITLDESNYYVAVAPVKLIWWQVIAICITVAIICFAALTIPSLLVKKIQPVKAIQFK
ncbi:MAG: ABC transporter permease [Chitinophagaceae bacterium]|nr:ABC transporter permease [Chitinophagaceae bacterium]MCW5905896.1 ABC transporter permease [Chitinophagaceae bacterium]